MNKIGFVIFSLDFKFEVLLNLMELICSQNKKNQVKLWHLIRIYYQKTVRMAMETKFINQVVHLHINGGLKLSVW